VEKQVKKIHFDKKLLFSNIDDNTIKSGFTNTRQISFIYLYKQANSMLFHECCNRKQKDKVNFSLK